MDKDYLILKRGSASRPFGQWSDDDFDVLANGEVVGRIYKANAAPVAPRGSHAYARIRANARGRNGSIRQESWRRE
jgi:hypothetical protein